MSESTPEEKQRQDDGSLRAPSPLVHGRISSDESEAEGPEEPIEFPSSVAHPKPLAVSILHLGLTLAKDSFLSFQFIQSDIKHFLRVESKHFFVLTYFLSYGKK